MIFQWEQPYASMLRNDCVWAEEAALRLAAPVHMGAADGGSSFVLCTVWRASHTHTLHV